MIYYNLHINSSEFLPDKTLSPAAITCIKKHVYAIYRDHGRIFPWRETTEPYHIVVSEIMLQQTQVNRVLPFYLKFLDAFPDFNTLANASLHDVLSVWCGLGYNRRAVALHQIAKLVVNKHQGTLPCSPEQLIAFPGIGTNTAGSIAAFAFNIPTVFIETNIRTVFLHIFFPHRTQVDDKDIMPLIAQTLDHNNPRVWYYALMDYGALLKQTVPNPSRQSKHHTIQSKFIGSDRRVRGAVIRFLTHHRTVPYDTLYLQLTQGNEPLGTKEQIDKVLHQLIHEKMIMQHNDLFCIYREDY